MDNINDEYKIIRNNYHFIKQQYESITGDSLNKDPISSVKNYPLTDCRCTISILIASWNSSPSLIYTLQTLSRTNLLCTFPDKVEIVIVDDGSDDDMTGISQVFPLPCKTRYYRQQHMGRAQAVNLAAYMAVGDIVIFCDADILVTPYALDELVKRQQMFLHEAIFFGFRQDVQADTLQVNGPEGIMKNTAIDLKADNRFQTDFNAGWGTNIMLETDMLQDYPCCQHIYVSDHNDSTYDCWPLYRMVYGFLFSISKKISAE